MGGGEKRLPGGGAGGEASEASHGVLEGFGFCDGEWKGARGDAARTRAAVLLRMGLELDLGFAFNWEHRQRPETSGFCTKTLCNVLNYEFLFKNKTWEIKNKFNIHSNAFYLFVFNL